MARRRKRARSDANRLVQQSSADAESEDRGSFHGDTRGGQRRSEDIDGAGWFVEDQIMARARNDFIEWP